MDFAGGTPVHISAGSAVAAMSLFFLFESRGFKRACGYLIGQLKTTVGSSLPWALVEGIVSTVRGRRPVRLHAGVGQDLPSREEEVYDVNQAVFGTAMIWFGWFGFNGGSALGVNNRAVSACLSTHVAACTGGVTAVLYHWVAKQTKKWKDPDNYEPNMFGRLTAIHFCDGAVSGLVAITPGAGYVRRRMALGCQGMS